MSLTIDECEGGEIRYPACVMTKDMARRVARDSWDICDLCHRSYVCEPEK